MQDEGTADINKAIGMNRCAVQIAALYRFYLIETKPHVDADKFTNP